MKSLVFSRVIAAVTLCCAVMVWFPNQVSSSTQPAANPKTLSIRIAPPQGQTLREARFRLMADPQETENALPETLPFEVVPEDGVIDLTLPSAPPAQGAWQLEVVSPTTRRMRFSLSDLESKSGQGRAVLQLQPGIQRKLTVIDGTHGGPISGAVIGPIIPDENAPADLLRLVYPFFEQTKSDGSALISGLHPESDYQAQISAPGYLRRRIRLAGLLEQTESLVPGGSTITAHLVGHRTGEIYPDLLVSMTGPQGLAATRIADSDGRVEFNGLGAGSYSLTLQAPQLGDTRPVPANLESPFPGHASPDPIQVSIPVPEGLNFAGQVLEQGTTSPLPGIRIQLGDQGPTDVTDQEGRFQFARVFGPWPRTFRILSPGYTFDSKQHPDSGEVTGFDLQDRDDLTLELQRERWLIIEILGGQSPPAHPQELNQTAVTIRRNHIQVEKSLQRELVTQRRLVLPLDSLEPRIIQALQTGPETFTALAMITPESENTTLTVQLNLEPEARILGRLRPIPEGEALPPSLQTQLVQILPDGSSIPVGTSHVSTTGSFVIRGLAKGQFELQVPRGRVREAAPWKRMPMNLAPGEVKNLDLELELGATFAGRVVSPEGAPLLEIPLVISGITPDGEPLSQKVMTDPEGRFLTRGWGPPSITAVRSQHHLWQDPQLGPQALPQTDFQIRLQPRPFLAVETDLPPSQRLLASAFLFLEGKISDEVADDYPNYTPLQQLPFAGSSSVLFTPQHEGRLLVGLQVQNQWLFSSAFDWSDSSSATTITLGAQAPARLTVELQGDATDLETAELTLTHLAIPGGGGNSVFSSAPPLQGRWIFDQLPAGPYLLLASTLSGATAVESELVLNPGQSAEIRLDLTPRLMQLQGQVINQAGLGQSAQLIVFRGPTGDAPPLAETRTDGTSGEFRLSSIPAGGPYLVLALLDDGQRLQTTVRLDPSAPPPPIILQTQAKVPQAFQLSPNILAQTQLGMPLLLIGTNGQGFSIKPDVTGIATIELPPGDYQVFLGEQQLPSITVVAPSDRLIRLGSD